MKRGFILAVCFVTISLAIFLNAAEFFGDGTHNVMKGDMITMDNGWQVEIIGIFMAHTGEKIDFRTYDSEGNPYPSIPYQSSLKKIEGKKKFGTNTVLKIEMELLEISGDTTPTASPMVTEYKNAKINIVSIDEALPGEVGEGDDDIEEVDKELTYKDGTSVSLGMNEERTLGNGYKLKLDRFDSRWGSPYFSLYDSQNNMIDNGIAISKDVGGSLGSFVYVDGFSADTVDLTIIDGSKVTFGTGWNLFSIHLEDGDGYGAVLESTCNKAPLWIWNNELDDYEKVGILEEGTKIPAGKGIWAKIQTKKNTQSDIDCEILVSGTDSATTEGQQLKAGWNLIGAPISAYGKRVIVEGGSNFNYLDFESILGDCKLEKGPWQYLGTKYSHFMIKSEIAEEHKFSQPFENNLRLNRGYFVKVIDDCIMGGI